MKIRHLLTLRHPVSSVLHDIAVERHGQILKRATNYRALLRNMIYEDKTPCDTTPPRIQLT